MIFRVPEDGVEQIHSLVLAVAAVLRLIPLPRELALQLPASNSNTLCWKKRAINS